MTRPARLRSVKDTRWIETYGGKDIVRGYVRWFGVDALCAVIELRMLGVPIASDREARIRASMEERAAARKRRRERAAGERLVAGHAMRGPGDEALTPDWDALAVQDRWCEERREEIAEYLEREGVDHGPIARWPAWHMAPHVSVWAIESRGRPGRVGWWVISGDLPTDRVSAATIGNPRDAVRAIAESWLEVSAYLRRREPPPDIILGIDGDWPDLVPLLESRAIQLLQWVVDPSLWEDDFL